MISSATLYSHEVVSVHDNHEMITVCFTQRVVEDIKRKGYEVDRMVDLSQDMQDILNVSLNFMFPVNVINTV